MRRNLITGAALALVLGSTQTAHSIEAADWDVQGELHALVKVSGRPGTLHAKGPFNADLAKGPRVVFFNFESQTLAYIESPDVDPAKRERVSRAFILPASQLQLDLENDKPKRAKLASTSPDSAASVTAAFTALFDAFPERTKKTRPDPTNYGDADLDGDSLRVSGKLRLRRKGTRLVGKSKIVIHGTFTSGPFVGEDFRAGLILRLGGQEGED